MADLDVVGGRLSPAMLELVEAVLKPCSPSVREGLMRHAESALIVEISPTWLDVRPAKDLPKVECPSGRVPVEVDFILVAPDWNSDVFAWVENGYFTGLEQPWTSDEPPSRWPKPHELVYHNIGDDN
ncbi:hypothetical protein FB460_0280 [Propioniferax innocua]|uniref:Uncharacterized protein n=1 Tax=Propioniferax innocua TaxID=1753 RepID=A0A542ZQ65_9ACTN|nr:hypothetical protein FB460_0280 [Propioniferax innocua]